MGWTNCIPQFYRKYRDRNSPAGRYRWFIHLTEGNLNMNGVTNGGKKVHWDKCARWAASTGMATHFFPFYTAVYTKLLPTSASKSANNCICTRDESLSIMYWSKMNYISCCILQLLHLEKSYFQINPRKFWEPS